ncbi:hypothetical protein M758_10G106200 [Ceratodon purpureus]|nr:hypothetical protein M758_10G106200 [Ceratodon purpureus]
MSMELDLWLDVVLLLLNHLPCTLCPSLTMAQTTSTKVYRCLKDVNPPGRHLTFTHPRKSNDNNCFDPLMWVPE